MDGIERSDELLEGCRQGSLPSFERLYEEHGARMKSIARNLLGSVPEAEDAVQDAFLKVYRGLGRFRGGSAFSTWVYRILVNVCYDRVCDIGAAASSARCPPGSRSRTRGSRIIRCGSRSSPRSRGSRNASAPRSCCARWRASRTREASEILEVSEGSSRALLFKARRRLQQELRAGGAFLPAEAP